MKLLKTHLLAALVLALCAFDCRPAAADLMTNGGFETGDFTGWTLSAAQTIPSNFVYVSGPAVDNSLGYNITINPDTGNYFALLGFNGSTPTEGITGIGTVSQVIPTVVGEQYTFNFAYYTEPGTPNDFTANFGDQTVFSVANDLSFTANPAVWEHLSYTVTADSSSTTIAFISNNDPGYAALDSVSVTPAHVPEPSSLILCGLAGLGLLSIARRRRRA